MHPPIAPTIPMLLALLLFDLIVLTSTLSRGFRYGCDGCDIPDMSVTDENHAGHAYREWHHHFIVRRRVRPG